MGPNPLEIQMMLNMIYLVLQVSPCERSEMEDFGAKWCQTFFFIVSSELLWRSNPKNPRRRLELPSSDEAMDIYTTELEETRPFFIEIPSISPLIQGLHTECLKNNRYTTLYNWIHWPFASRMKGIFCIFFSPLLIFQPSIFTPGDFFPLPWLVFQRVFFPMTQFRSGHSND